MVNAALPVNSLTLGSLLGASDSTAKGPIVRTASGLARKQFTPLPQSKEEVDDIARRTLSKPSMVLVGDDATEARFKSLPLEDYNVVHLALHGYVDEEFPERFASYIRAGAGRN